MFVSRKLANPTPPTTSDSSDHRLRAIQSESGTLLRANFGTYFDESILRTNLFPDPGVEHRFDMWRDTGAAQPSIITQDTSRFHSGSHSLLVNSGTLGNGGFDAQFVPDTPIEVKAGHTYTFSAWVYNPSVGGVPTGYAVRCVAGGTAGNGQNWPDMPFDQWVLTWTTVTAAADGGVAFYVYLSNTANIQAWWDDFGFCEGTEPVDFSGDDATSGLTYYRWTGPVGSSPSEEYTPAGSRLSKETIQGPVIHQGEEYLYAGKDISYLGILDFDGDTPADDLFRYDWQDDAHTVSLAQPVNPIESVRFIRGTSLETGIPVRSGNDAPAPDGVAYAFDMEEPLGVASIWQAYPVYRDGTVGDPTAAVDLFAVEPSGFYDTWLKSVQSPQLSRRVLLTKDSIPAFTKAARLALQNPQGSPYPVGARDVHTAATSTFSAYTSTTEEEDDMWALLESGTLLFQTRQEYHIPDFYFEVGDITMTLTGAGTALVSRRWTIPVTIVGRPTPLGASMAISGGAYDDIGDLTYDQLEASWPSYDAFIEAAV